MLLWIGAAGTLTFAHTRGIAESLALAMFCFCLIGYPLLAPLIGRQWHSAEMFGLAPNPTALATLAVLSLAEGGYRWLLVIIPLIWCGITGLTLWTMGSGDFFIAPTGALAALAIALIRTRQRHHLPSA